MSVFSTLEVRAALCVVASLATAGLAETWPTRQRDNFNTGRAAYTIPTDRLNSGLFGVFAWQKPMPGGVDEGNTGGSSPIFFDGVGPGGSDMVVCGYHWPKGVMAVDRHTGTKFWHGNPRGGELIGEMTPAFSLNGQTLYLVNDSTQSVEFPNGHALMAFASSSGPASYWHTGGSACAPCLSTGSPKVALDGRIFAHAWDDRPYAAADSGLALTAPVWSADTRISACFSELAMTSSGGTQLIVMGGRNNKLTAFNASSGATVWSKSLSRNIDAAATVDPATGRVYVAAGSDTIDVVAVNADGTLPWNTLTKRVFTYSVANNPQLARSAGCLSHDGLTFYFQTVSRQNDGRLYAINTTNGTTRWSLATQSGGWDEVTSSPIVTPNGIVIVGNNNGGVYYAVRDNGSSATVIATFATDAGGPARSSAAISADGMLYLPLKTAWIASNGDGDVPSANTRNMLCAIDLRSGATAVLPPPGGQAAAIRNHGVHLKWNAIPDAAGVFDHYNVYRSSSAFTDVTGMTPIATVAPRTTTQYLDTSAANGSSYYYAVTTATAGGGERKQVASMGPRTPRDETDLQVVSVARTPRFPRYAVNYTGFTITEPSGFGPYFFTSATGLGQGQTDSTPRWPTVGQAVLYTGTIRNRGTNAIAASIGLQWLVDGQVVSSTAKSINLEPGQTTTVTLPRTWDDQLHTIECRVVFADARPENNALAVGSKSVGFLTYADESMLEAFRERSKNWPGPKNDDLFDWLNAHMKRFNELFAAANTSKRVHYEILETLVDGSANPSIDTIPFAIFPFRYRADEGDPRLSGYYRASEDIDYGLLHEMGHQLGLIDLYQLDISAEMNEVSGLSYTGPECLMRTCASFLSESTATAMEHWANKAHGYFGQYLYGMPQTIKMRFLASGGGPLAGATVTMYQLTERPGVGKRVFNQAKAIGTTDSNGVWTLPNVPVQPAMAPPTPAGDTLQANPFGYVAVVGANGVLHFKIEKSGSTDYAWLNVTEPNVAFYKGQTQEAVFERQTGLGGAVQSLPPDDMAENNAVNWKAWADGATYTVENDEVDRTTGDASIKGVTTGGFDTMLAYPKGLVARWNLAQTTSLHFDVLAFNENFAFQGNSPWIVLRSANGGSIRYEPTYDRLNEALDNWRHVEIPLAGNAEWVRSTIGNPDIGAISSLEIHADTWGYGFTLWVDGVGFDPRACAGDLDANRVVDDADFVVFLQAYNILDCADETMPDFCRADLNTDGFVNDADFVVFVAAYNELLCP